MMVKLPIRICVTRPQRVNYTPRTTKLLGGYTGFTPSVHPSVCPSVRPPVRPSVRPSVRPACRVRSVSSTVMDGFFSYWAQMITTMRGCVVRHDLWPWPISSRSFGLDLENRVRSVASTVLDGFFSIFGTNDHYHKKVCCVLRFFQNLEI